MSQNYSFFIVYGVPLVHCKSYERTIYDTLILARVSYTLTSCFTSVSQKKKGIEWRISFSINVMMICSALFLLLVPRICVDHVDGSVISDRLTKHSALMWCSLFWKPFSMISHVSHREENIVYESRLHQTKAIVRVQYTQRDSKIAALIPQSQWLRCWGRSQSQSGGLKGGTERKTDCCYTSGVTPTTCSVAKYFGGTTISLKNRSSWQAGVRFCNATLDIYEWRLWLFRLFSKDGPSFLIDVSTTISPCRLLLKQVWYRSFFWWWW